MRRLAVFVGLAVALSSGCNKEPPPPPPPPAAPAPPPPPPAVPFHVTVVELGKGIQPDNSLQTATTTFGPKDTIYLVVTSEGVAPQAAFETRWTYGPKDVLVHEEAKTVTPPSAKPMRTEFHISKPSGWPAGDYKVVLTLDGQAAQTKTFSVAKAGKTR